MDKPERTVEALYRGSIRMMEVTFDPALEMAEEDTMKQTLSTWLRTIPGSEWDNFSPIQEDFIIFVFMDSL